MIEQNTNQKIEIPNIKAKKTRKKLVGEWLNGSLAFLKSPLEKYYWRAKDCSTRLIQEGNTVKSTYCNARTCPTCNGIRTASYLKHYGEQLLSFSDAQFLTLTAPTNQAFSPVELKEFIILRELVWRKIYDNAKKRKIILKGMKAMEITSRPDNYYHIHFHFIVDGIENAKWIKEQWLKHYPKAIEKYQVILPIRTKEGLLEVFKYGTKFFNKEKVTIDGKQKEVYKKVEPERIDLIIQALYKKRLISTFGGVRALKDDDVNELVEEVSIEDLKAVEYAFWDWVLGVDWFNIETGEKFSDYEPSEELRRVFSG